MGLFGGGGGKADTSNYSNALWAATLMNMKMAEQAREDMRPYREAGDKTLPYYAGILNIPGYEPVDPTEALEATPGYNWMYNQGLEAIDRAAAAKGMLGSGPVAKQLINYGQGMAQTKAYEPYMNKLYGLVGTGANAAAQSGQYGMQAASNLTGPIIQGGQLQDQAQYYNSQNQGNWLNTVASGAGLLGSILLSPATGGSSLIGGLASTGLGALNNTVLGKSLSWNM